MRKVNKILISIGVTMLLIQICHNFGLIDLSPSKQKVKVIDLPEEISVCSVGDTLKIERINQDTIFVVFSNKINN